MAAPAPMLTKAARVQAAKAGKLQGLAAQPAKLQPSPPPAQAESPQWQEEEEGGQGLGEEGQEELEGEQGKGEEHSAELGSGEQQGEGEKGAEQEEGEEHSVALAVQWGRGKGGGQQGQQQQGEGKRLLGQHGAHTASHILCPLGPSRPMQPGASARRDLSRFDDSGSDEAFAGGCPDPCIGGQARRRHKPYCHAIDRQ